MNPPLTMMNDSPLHRIRAGLIWLTITIPVAMSLLWVITKVGVGRWDAILLGGLALGVVGGLTKVSSP